MGQIVVEGPDGKKYAFPDTMPREQINAFLRNKYGTKTRDETATQYLQRIGREQKAAEDLRRSKEAQIKDVERVAAGMASEGAMSNPGAFYLAGPSAMQSGREASAPIYKGANMVPEDQAFAGGMANAAGLWLPEMLSQPYREGLARARSDQPGWTMAGDFAGGMMSGEVIGAGLEAGIRAVAPRVRQLGAMFKSGKAAADDARLLESIRDPRMLTEGGDPIANARLLDEWQVPADQAAYPMGFFGGKKPAADQIPSVTISPEERAMLTGEAPKGSARTVTAKEAASQTADPEYMAARKQAFLSPEEIATLLDAPSDIKPGGFDVTRPSVTKRKYGTESFSDPRLSVDQNKAVEMRKNGYTVREIADEMDTSEDVIYHHFMAARRKGVEMGGIAKDNTTVDILTLKEKGLKPREIAERLGVPRNQVNVMLAQARRRIEASGSELPPWLVPGKGGRPMGPAVGDFAENVFSAGVSSAMGSAPTVDINGDGVIDETDRMLGASAGLALWASPMGLRQAAKLGGMMKGKGAADALEQPAKPAGFAAPAGSGKRASGFLDDMERGTETFYDERLGPVGSNWNKTVEMAKNGYSNDEIAEALGMTIGSVKVRLSNARKMGIDIPKGYHPGAAVMTETGALEDILALKAKGLTPAQISERTGKKREVVNSMLSHERKRLRDAGKPVPSWLVETQKSGPRAGVR